jgi:HSP20 family protein
MKGQDMKLIRRQKQDRATLAPSGWGSLTPFNDLNRIRNQLDRIFEDPFSLATPTSSFFEGWNPAVDIYEDKDKYVVNAELPGMRREDIDVSLDGNTLTISGERKQEEEKKEGENYRSERYFGRFQRCVTLPSGVDANKIQASYKDGVLTVTLPKSEEAKPKQIQVKTS